MHRDPSQLNPPPPLAQVAVRKNLWWWMLHMDQQYSMTLGRPLGISSMGDCPAPVPLQQDPVIQSLSNYISQFTILARQIMSAGHLTNAQIDSFSDQLLALRDSLPDAIRFDASWLDEEKPIPQWPLEAQAAVFYGKTHNFLILLNRQRIENERRGSTDSAADISAQDDAENVPRGRERVLQSCRALLEAFDFFGTRVREAMICWTMGQQAFNAAMILTLAVIESGDTTDLPIIERAYAHFMEMNLLSIHKLAGVACEKLAALMKQVHDGAPALKEGVMGQQGMILLEDPGLQGFVPGGFSPLAFKMAGGEIERGNTGTGWSATTVPGTPARGGTGQGNSGNALPANAAPDVAAGRDVEHGINGTGWPANNTPDIANAAVRSNSIAPFAQNLIQRNDVEHGIIGNGRPANTAPVVANANARSNNAAHFAKRLTQRKEKKAAGLKPKVPVKKPALTAQRPSALARSATNNPLVASHAIKMTRGSSSGSGPPNESLTSTYQVHISRAPSSNSAPTSAVLPPNYSAQMTRPQSSHSVPSRSLLTSDYSDPNLNVGFALQGPKQVFDAFETTSRSGLFHQQPAFSDVFGSMPPASTDMPPNMCGVMPAFDATNQYAPQPGPPSYATANAHSSEQMSYSSDFNYQGGQMAYSRQDNDEGMEPWENTRMEGWY